MESEYPKITFKSISQVVLEIEEYVSREDQMGDTTKTRRVVIIEAEDKIPETSVADRTKYIRGLIK